MKKPEIGQIIYSLNVGNAARGCEQKLTPMKVVKVGRKYFELQKEGFWHTVKFHIDDWTQVTDYCSSHYLYETPKEYYDEKEMSEICIKMWENFAYGKNFLKLPLEKLRKLMDVIYD